MLLAQRNVVRVSKCIWRMQHGLGQSNRWCNTTALPERNAAGKGYAVSAAASRNKEEFEMAMSRHKDYFNNNPLESIKEEFEMEMQDIGRGVIHMPPHKIHENIARISDRLEVLDRNHQTFSDIHNAVTRAMKQIMRRMKEEEKSETIDHVQQRFAEINGNIDSKLQAFKSDLETSKGAEIKGPGTYGKAKQFGNGLIVKYHEIMSNHYSNTHEQLVRGQ